MGSRFLSGAAALTLTLSACATSRPMLVGTDASLTPRLAIDSVNPNTLSIRVRSGSQVAVYAVSAFPRRVRHISTTETASAGGSPLLLPLDALPNPAPVTRRAVTEPPRRVARYCIDGPAFDNPTRDSPGTPLGYRWGCTWELRPVREEGRPSRVSAPRSYYVVLAFEPAPLAANAAQAAAAVRATGTWYEVAERLARHLFGTEAATRWSAAFIR